ncbi:Solute carrier family 35 member C2 [Hondaea fermentalgiana]|uniref:Solute carrier family 35 member C2 n=1 Tax=Hondaea fermentalgiana TaxID=2315210 RepID=A0A2R5GEA1_9STRA|nr:Solute carrier family 35 member C2 [Hondaea fermentalgiana]|eukprot:GBG29277.1 Solute carrier family 35 member C2 [Hondaea fermentalgiana]
MPGKRRELTLEVAEIAYWSALWFGFSVSMVVYNKWLLHSWEGGFNFPLLISMLHMGIKYFLSLAMVRCNSFAIPDIPRRVWWLSAVPVGCATALDVAASNASYLYVSVTFYTIVKSSSLVFTLLFSVLYKLQPCSLSLFCAVSVIVVGVVLASMGDTEFSTIGFLLVIGSSAVGGFRWSLTQVLMKQIRCNLDAILTIYLISPASALSLIPLSLWVDGERFFQSKFIDASLLPYTVLNIVGSGLFAFSMILVELELLRRTSSVTLGVISYVKQMLQIGLSVVVFHDVLTPLNLLGFLLTLLGMFLYTVIKHRARAEAPHAGGKYGAASGGHIRDEEEGLFIFEDYGDNLGDDHSSGFGDDQSLNGTDFELIASNSGQGQRLMSKT